MRVPAPILLLWAALQLVPEARGQEARPGKAQRDAYLRMVATHFHTSLGETEVLTAWGLGVEETPVVLYLATRGGVSPDAVVSFRRDGLSWLELARRLGVGVGEFYVPVNGPTGSLAGAYARFERRPRREWAEVSLSDDEVTSLVNLRVLSRELPASPRRILAAYEDLGDFVAVYDRLAGANPS